MPFLSPLKKISFICFFHSSNKKIEPNSRKNKTQRQIKYKNDERKKRKTNRQKDNKRAHHLRLFVIFLATASRQRGKMAENQSASACTFVSLPERGLTGHLVAQKEIRVSDCTFVSFSIHGLTGHLVAQK